MKKIIKEFKINKMIYQLGYNLWIYEDIICPAFEIYTEENIFLGYGNWNHKSVDYPSGIFNLDSYKFHENFKNKVSTIEDLFKELRRTIEIPIEVENEFENIFILYKLNNFKEL